MTAPIYAPLSQPPPPSPLDSAARDFAAALRALVAAAVDAAPSQRDAIVSRGQAIHDEACALLWHGGAR